MSGVGGAFRPLSEIAQDLQRASLAEISSAVGINTSSGAIAPFQHIRQAQVLAHISGQLLCAEDTPYNQDATFLGQLETLCTWPKAPATALKGDKPGYPTLLGMSSNPKSVNYSTATRIANTGFLAYASSSAQEQSVLGYFRIIRPLELRNIDDHLDIDNITDRIQTKDIEEKSCDLAARGLYDTLSKYAQCTRTSLDHEARLCLTGPAHRSEDFAAFDMHFLGCPDASSNAKSSFWQQLRLQVSSSTKRVPIVKIRVGEQDIFPQSSDSSDAESGAEAHSPSDKKYPISHEEFCQLLSANRGPVKIRMEVHNNALLDLDRSATTEQTLAPGPSIALADVLTSYDLSMKMKLVLAYKIARSVWQYYESDWTKCVWSCKSIHFMLEETRRSAKTPQITCRPCLSTRFGGLSDGVPECCNLQHVAHKYLRILSLGTLLSQIGMDAYEDDPNRMTYDEVQRVNHDCTAGQRIKGDTSWPRMGHPGKAGDDLRKLYRQATLSCFDEKLFKASKRSCDRCRRIRKKCIFHRTQPCKRCHGEGIECTDNTIPRSERQDSSFYINIRRKALLDHVVKPLRQAAQQFQFEAWDKLINSSDPIPLSSSRNQTPGIFGKAQYGLHNDPYPIGQKVSVQVDEARFFDDERLAQGELRLKHSEYLKWKTAFIQTAESFEPDAYEDDAQRVRPASVKIAVLDTGIDRDHDDIFHQLNRMWVFDQSENCFKSAQKSLISDSHGHGTHIAGLMLEYADTADLYIGDITVNGEANRAILANAIRCAVDSRVDIISISCGFEKRIPGDDLEQAIEYAHEKKVHVFAAASNNGGNTSRAFPARYDNVFCIYSTDADGNPSGFNPTEDPEEVNFATIGEAVESSWPRHLCTAQDVRANYDGVTATEIKSGTSFATPIAASLAAFLLRYARLHLDQDHIEQLKRHSVMTSALKTVAGVKRKGFYYLTLRSNPDHLFGESREDIRRAIMKAVQQSG